MKSTLASAGRSLISSAIAATLALTFTHTAQAFCGFYVDEGGKTLANDATQVVLMRSGTKTVLSMQNDYKGPPEKFAMVVPVPVVLQKENVKTLPKAVLEKLEQLDAPRLVEYWEQDPCAEYGRGDGIGLGNIGGIGHGAGTGTGSGYGAHQVTVEAEFTVGEYDIVILSATDSSALDGWLKGNGYHIPDGAEPLLRPYVAAGMKFFVAKIDPKKLTFADGHAALSPLRFHYDSDTFSLPVRLGLLNATGKQDLVVHILANQQRYEAANYANLTMPTNIDVDPKTKGTFGSFYASLFDHVSATHPQTVITEYSWNSGTCDPCPGPTLNAADLATLGADVVGGAGGPLVARYGKIEASANGLNEAVVQRMLRMQSGALGACSKNGSAVDLHFTVDSTGTATAVSVTGAGAENPAAKRCFITAVEKTTFPRPPSPTKVTAPLTFYSAVGSPMTLTRLHLRYSKDELRDDLVFKVAEPIVGGREMMAARGDGDGGLELEHGSRKDTTNNFQSRYVIRHAWPGAVTCTNPVRGVWGAPWPDAGVESTPAAATKLAFAKRDVAFASYLTPSGATELSAAVGQLPTTTAAPSASAAPSAAPAASTTPAAKGGGCNSCTAAGDEGASFVPIAGLVALALARLRRRTSTSRTSS